MKKNILKLAVLFIIVVPYYSCDSDSLDESGTEAMKYSSNKKNACATIQSGELFYPTNHFLERENLSTDFDIFGYNYQSHSFKGYYANLYLGDIGFPPYEGQDDDYLIDNPEVEDNDYFMFYYWPYRNDMVNMTWNNTWLSNMDCNGDGLLDDENNTVGSGAWQNYHSKGSYIGEDGSNCDWVQKVKIIAVPEGSKLKDGIWYDKDDNEIGQDFYGAWVIIQKLFNDPCGETNQEDYKSPHRIGFGNR
jgi:hypothetical protein